MAIVNRRRTDEGEWRYDVRYRARHPFGVAAVPARRRAPDADIAAGFYRMVDLAGRRPLLPSQPTAGTDG